MKKTTRSIFIAAALSANMAFGQSVVLQEIFFSEFITFYVSSVDISTGSTDVPLFEYELRSAPLGTTPAYPVWVAIQFEMLITSAALGLSGDPPFLSVLTEPFKMEGPIRIRNTELGLNTQRLYYSGGTLAGESVPITILDENMETIFDDPDYNIDDLQSLIIQSGRLPDGNYRFIIRISAWADVDGEQGPALAGDELDRTIVASHPVALELITPGGFLEDTTNTAITTTYPFFQWESDPCAFCSYFIRVAQFKPDEHSTMEDAIEDLTVLPLDQAAGFVEVGNATSYQYPLSGAADLEPGRVYVWQVQKAIPTTERDEFVNSFIYAFKVLDPTVSTTSAGAGGVTQDPILQFLQSVMGTEQYEITFRAGGDLAGFTPTNIIILNGGPGDLNDLTTLNAAVDQGEVSIISVEVQ